MRVVKVLILKMVKNKLPDQSEVEEKGALEPEVADEDEEKVLGLIEEREGKVKRPKRRMNKKKEMVLLIGKIVIIITITQTWQCYFLKDRVPLELLLVTNHRLIS